MHEHISPERIKELADDSVELTPEEIKKTQTCDYCCESVLLGEDLKIWEQKYIVPMRLNRKKPCRCKLDWYCCT